MIKALCAATILLALSSGVAFAQAPEAGAPAPGPEHKRLGYFVGTWSSEGEMKPNPFMPGGTVTSKDVCEWFEGGFAVVCSYTGASPMGPTKGIGIMSYSTEEKKYTYLGVDNSPMAMTSVPLGTVQDGTWTYEDTAKMGGEMVKSRWVMTEQSPTAYTYRWEMQGADGTWQTVMQGTSTKK